MRWGPLHFQATSTSTKADGTVEEKRMPTRKVQAFHLASPGSEYKLEVMGDRRDLGR